MAGKQTDSKEGKQLSVHMKDYESYFVVSAAELTNLQHLSLAFYMYFFYR